jgi:hypothetical protein
VKLRTVRRWPFGGGHSGPAGLELSWGTSKLKVGGIGRRREGALEQGANWSAELGWVRSFQTNDNPGPWSYWLLRKGLDARLQYRF